MTKIIHERHSSCLLWTSKYKLNLRRNSNFKLFFENRREKPESNWYYKENKNTKKNYNWKQEDTIFENMKTQDNIKIAF